MKKLMVLAAMLAMAMAVAVPAFADHQTSGAATSGGASLTAGDLANQCAQVANNVNSGNVSQEAAAANIQANLGALAVLEQDIEAGAFADVFNLGFLFAFQDVDQDVDQDATNVIVQEGIEQVNNAELECNQAIVQTKK